MDIEAYCDEAYPDLFSSRTSTAPYLVIGGIWLARENRVRFKDALHDLRDAHKVGGEFKWGKVTPSRLSFYKDVITWFFEQGESLRFRCIAVPQAQVNLALFHQNDQELGFYKFYYQMLHKWIHDHNSYTLFCDFKSNRRRDRLAVLQQCLACSNLSARVNTVQAVRSDESLLIQLADLLTGATAAKLNGKLAQDSAKCAIVALITELLGRELAPTPLAEKKFNIFRINLQGGW